MQCITSEDETGNSIPLLQMQQGKLGIYGIMAKKEKGGTEGRMEDLRQIVAKNIVALRNARGMTQLALGEQLAYSDKAVSKWERGEALPDAAVLKKMAGIFGVTVDYLLQEHSDGERVPRVLGRFNPLVATLISLIGVWTLALFLFLVLKYAGIVYPMVFAYALPVSLLVLLVLNSVWRQGRQNAVIISAFVWSILLMFFLLFLEKRLWGLFLLGLPAQTLILLSFRVMRKR